MRGRWRRWVISLYFLVYRIVYARSCINFRYRSFYQACRAIVYTYVSQDVNFHWRRRWSHASTTNLDRTFLPVKSLFHVPKSSLQASLREMFDRAWFSGSRENRIRLKLKFVKILQRSGCNAFDTRETGKNVITDGGNLTWRKCVSARLNAFDERRRRVGGHGGKEDFNRNCFLQRNTLFPNPFLAKMRSDKADRDEFGAAFNCWSENISIYRAKSLLEKNFTRSYTFSRSYISLGYFDRANIVNGALNVSFLIISQNRLRKILPSWFRNTTDETESPPPRVTSLTREKHTRVTNNGPWKKR